MGPGPPDEVTPARGVPRAPSPVASSGTTVVVWERPWTRGRESGGRRRGPRQAPRRRRRRAHRVPGAEVTELAELRRRASRRRAPSTRSSRTPWPAAPSRRRAATSLLPLLEGPVAIAFVHGDASSRPRRCATSPGPTRPRHQGRAARPGFLSPDEIDPSPTSSPARCSSPGRRRLPGAAHQGRRPVPGASPATSRTG